VDDGTTCWIERWGNGVVLRDNNSATQQKRYDNKKPHKRSEHG
jgi:hypothetical protein